MATLFASDLHLTAARPDICEQFETFLAGPVRQAERVYLLGDLFEYWAGDDDDDTFNASVLTALHQVVGAGVKLYVMHGNRDFLIGKRFAAASGAELLDDPRLLDLYGTRTLLMHGDTLCTDDVRYLEFRAKVRSPQWQNQFLAQTLAQRKAIIAGLRSENTAEKKLKTEVIMDATVAGVEATLRAHGYPRLIHGHTHRPALHRHVVDGRACERWVLADWYTSGSYLECDAAGCRVVKLATA